VLPLLISGFEHYSDGVHVLADIWNVGHEIDAFVKSLKVQELIFRTTVVEFLGPISSQQGLKNLLNDPHGDAWKAPSLYKNLRTHYSGSYETYLILLERILSTVKELHSVGTDLGFQKGKQVGGESSSSHEHRNAGCATRAVVTSTAPQEGNSTLSQPFGPGITQGLARAKFVLLRKARTELLTRLSNDIGQFTELHHSDTKITRNARKWDIGGRFRQRRDEVSSIHNVLANDWRCDCTHVHDVYLQLSLLDTKVLENDPKERFVIFSCPDQHNNENTAAPFCQRVTLTVTEVQKNVADADVAPAPKAHAEDNRSTKSSSLKKFKRIVSRAKEK
jgi:hypothetical protein